MPNQDLERSSLRRGLARVRRNQGAHAEAERLYRQALASSLKHSIALHRTGTGTLAEARSLCGLAALQTGLSESETMLTRCLAIKDAKTTWRRRTRFRSSQACAGRRAELRKLPHSIVRPSQLTRSCFPAVARTPSPTWLAISRLLPGAGDANEAESLARLALEIRRNRTSPKDSSRVVEVETVWTAAMNASGRTGTTSQSRHN